VAPEWLYGRWLGTSFIPPGPAGSWDSMGIYAGAPSPGRHCHSALSLAVIDCHWLSRSLGICAVILLPLWSRSAKMTASPRALGAPVVDPNHPERLLVYFEGPRDRLGYSSMPWLVVCGVSCHQIALNCARSLVWRLD
jgi:hypothetical protein